MRCIRILPVLLLAMLLGSPGRVVAQSTSSSGMFGNRTTGTGITAGTSSAFGSNSALSNLSQNGTLGSSGMGSSTGVGGQARTAGSFVGATTGQAAQQSFVGAAQVNPSGSSQFGSGGMGGGGMGMGGMGGGGMGGFGMGAMLGRRLAQGGMNNTTTPPPPVRTTLTLGSDLAVAAVPQQVSSAIAEHLGVLPALHWQGPAQVEMRGRTAILRGVVATEHDRDLAERVVRLEAAVDQVQNQIVVAGQAMPKAAPTVERIPPASTPGAGSSAAERIPAARNSVPVPALVPPALPPVDNSRSPAKPAAN